MEEFNLKEFIGMVASAAIASAMTDAESPLVTKWEQ